MDAFVREMKYNTIRENIKYRGDNIIIEDKYEYWFANIPNLSHIKKRRLIEMVQDAREIYQVERLKQLPFLNISDADYERIKCARDAWDLDAEYEKKEQMHIHVVTWGMSNYPKRLKPYQDAPYAIFYKGELPKEDEKTAAIVGARRCSPYGEKYAMEYSRLLTSCGVQVISGMANGIDGIAQRTAIEEGGKSYAVLGCGADICYPRNHAGLYRDLSAHGGVLSELPIGTAPLAHHFPLRNRIISALSDVVLVIEAKERSGSLITADLALEQGKEVYALPGMADSELSRGCNELIKQGAGLLNNPEEFMEELGIFVQKSIENSSENKKMLENREKLVYSCLCLEVKHIDWVQNKTKVPINELINILVSLELKGYIREYSKNYYAKL